jgi:hypothetical protein
MIFKKPLKETLKKGGKPKIFQDIITIELISSFNTSQNISSFKNPHMKNRPIIIIIT